MSGPADQYPELPVDPDVDVVIATARPLHMRPAALGFVFVGGFAGTMARYGLALAEPTRTGTWPWGTFIANMAGAFILGALLEMLARMGPDVGWRQRARLLIGTGFCGGFTTYSTLAVETDLLVRAHCYGLAAAYALVTVALGLVLTVAGIAAAAGRHRLHGRGGAT